MKRYSFATFLVDDANRGAFEACRDVANLRLAGAQPIVLQGERGFGKTHLLYSIVNRVRGASKRTGIAYIRGEDFPSEVRDLPANPATVQRASSAILLVDDLEDFTDTAAELESVVRLFLEYKHYVVFAAESEAAELRNLTPGLREILGRARAVKILPSQVQDLGDSVYEGMEDHDALMTRQQERIAELEAGMQASQEEVSRRTSAAPDPAMDESLREMREELKLTRAALEGTEGELEHLRGENALLNVSTRELDPLRKRAKELEDMLFELRSFAEDDALRTQSGHGRAREKANEVLAEADELMSEVEHGPNASEDDSESPLSDLQDRRERDEEMRETLARANVEIDQLKEAVAAAQAEQGRLSASEDASQLANELSASRAECDRLRGAIVRARAERETVKAQHRRTLEELNRNSSQLESLHEEATQREKEAAVRISEIQDRLEAMGRELSETKKANRVIAAELHILHAQLTESTGEPNSIVTEQSKTSVPEERGPLNIAELRGPLYGSDVSSEEESTKESDADSEDDSPLSSAVAGPHPNDTPESHDMPKAAAVGEEASPAAPSPAQRPDFGDAGRSSGPPTRSLHHVEEIRAGLDALSKTDADESSSDEDADSDRPREKTA